MNSLQMLMYMPIASARNKEKERANVYSSDRLNDHTFPPHPPPPCILHSKKILSYHSFICILLYHPKPIVLCDGLNGISVNINPKMLGVVG
jgi:hypothetical protein